MVVVDAGTGNPSTVLDWELRSAEILCTFLQFQEKTLPQLIDKRFMASWLLFLFLFQGAESQNRFRLNKVLS